MISRSIILISLFFPILAFSSEPNTGSVSPETSLRWLVNGNTRFNKSYLRKDGQSHSDVVRLSSSQHPHAIVLSCSDSRVPPELVFDQKLGEIFTVRTAGEALDDNVVGSIEYAVEHLGARLIVVMGHTSCGAVKAAYSTLDGSSAGTPALDSMMGPMHARLKEFKGQTASKNFEKESWVNAEGVAKDLIRKSTVLGGKWEKGELWIVPSLYDLDSGKVAFRENLSMESKRTPAAKAVEK